MKRVVPLLLSALSLSVGAQERLEVIRLQNKTAEQVLPTLRPLVESGGALTGSGNALFIRASAANRAEIKKALAAMDTPIRRLMITVRQDNDLSTDASGVGVSGNSGNERVRIQQPGSRNPPGSSIEIRRGDDVIRGQAYSTRGRADDRIAQQVQTVEGGRAFIQVGYSFPVPMRSVAYGPGGALLSESVIYRDLATGFYAQPMVAGSNVTIEISPQQESLSNTVEGAVRSSRLSTTVSGRLGEWIPLGSTGQDASRERSGGFSYSTRGTLEQRRVLLMVEELQ